MSRFREVAGTRLQWRVLVRTAGRADSSGTAAPLAWHLVPCTDPLLATAHCAEGQRLLSQASDPDGHCLIEGECPRCQAAAPDQA
jgi:hypothetical protein